MSLSISNSKKKRYITGFLWFILFIFLFDRGLFYLISNLETNFYQESDFEKRFEKYMKNKHFSTLIFGTSRTYEGIHPFYIERELNQKAYKESFVGKGPKYNYYFYQLYKKYAGIPRVVIYGVDYFIHTVTSDPKWMSRFNIDNKNEKSVYCFSSSLLLVRYKKKIDNFFNNILIRLKEKWEREQGKEEEPLRDFIRIQNYIGSNVKNKKLDTKKYHKYMLQRYPPFPGHEGEYFIKLLDELEKDQVTVILVALPDYIGTFRTNFESNKFTLYLRRLSREYKNLFFYNYNNRKKFPRYKSEYFNDGGYGQTNSHLSRKGARLFNEKLVKDLKKHYK